MSLIFTHRSNHRCIGSHANNKSEDIKTWTKSINQQKTTETIVKRQNDIEKTILYNSRTDNTMDIKQENKQRSTKYYTEN